MIFYSNIIFFNHVFETMIQFKGYDVSVKFTNLSMKKMLWNFLQNT